MNRIKTIFAVFLVLTIISTSGTALLGINSYAADDGGKTGGKVITKVSYTPSELTPDGGKVSAVLEGNALYTDGWLTPEIYCGNKLIQTVKLNEDELNYDFDLPMNCGTEDKVYTVKYISSRYGGYEVPVQQGNEPIIVKGRETAMDPVISSLSYNATSFKSNGGDVSVSVEGSALTQFKSEYLSLKRAGASTSENIELNYSAENDSKAVISFSLPENKSDQDIVYELTVDKCAAEVTNSVQILTVKALNDTPIVESISYTDNITRLTYHGIPDNGYSYIILNLEGDNLFKLDKSDFEFAIDGEKIDLDDSAEYSWDRQFDIYSANAESAEIHIAFPKNELEKQRECTITVLRAADTVEDKTKTLIMAAKPESSENKFQMETDDWTVSRDSDGVVRVYIENPAKAELNFSPEKAGDYIFFSGNNNEPYTDVVNLTDGDKVSMSDNVMTITFAEGNKKLPAFIVLKSGTLRNGEGKILGKNSFKSNHYAYIHPSAHINRMEYSCVTLDSKGGEVSVKITGTNLQYHSLQELYIKVFRDGDRSASSSIPASDVMINRDGTEAEFVFDAPANTTGRTMSYRLMPVLDGTNAIPTYIKGYDVISVLPEGADSDETTLSSAEVQGAYDMDDDPGVFKTSTSAEQFTTKIDAVIRGTNLSSKRTVVKAVDENGVVWPMLPVFECGATIRWQNSSTYLPEKESKNEQHIELLLPRRLGVPHTFKLYFAPDGENFVDDIYATVIVENNGLYDEDAIMSGLFTREDFTELKDVVVKYVDTKGKEIAESDHYKGYGITELYHQGIGPKIIDGYTLKSYKPDNLDKMLAQPVKHTTGEYIFPQGQWFVSSLKGEAIVYVYAKDDPAKADPAKSGDSKADSREEAANEYVKINSGTVKITSEKNLTASFAKASNKRNITVPATVKAGNKTYRVTSIDPKAFKGKKIRKVTIGKNVTKISKNAFKGSKVSKVIVRSKGLTKKNVRGSLKGSKVRSVKVKAGKKALNKKYVKKYKKIFTLKNAGRKVKVK